MAAREHFILLGQAHGGAVPAGPVELILDANVVSIAENLGRKGFNPESIEHRRMVNLAAWLARRPGSDVNVLMGLPEGSGFDGTISAPHMLARRLAVSQIVFAQFLRGNADEVFRSIPIVDKYGVDLPDIDELQDNIREIFGSVVLPNYLMLLAWTMAFNNEPAPDVQSRFGRLRKSLERMIDNVGFIPLMWPTLIYAELGDKDLQNSITNKVLKLHRNEKTKSLRSGAWDIGLLQFISLLRASDSPSEIDAKTPVLVTNDEEFALYASILPALADSGLYELDESRIEPTHIAAFKELLAQQQAHRKPEDVIPPSWETLIDIAVAWERELGFSDDVILRRDFEQITIRPNHSHTADLVRVIGRSATREDLLRACEEIPNRMVTAAFLAILLLHHLADGRDVKEVFLETLEKRLPQAIGSRYYNLSMSVIGAMLVNNPSQTAAIFGTVNALSSPGLVIFGIVVICDELAEELAKKQSRGKAELCSDLSARLNESIIHGD